MDSFKACELDGHAKAYESTFPHYRENQIVHVAYGHRVARHIEACGAQKVLSLGIGHSDVARPILELLTRQRISRYVIVDGSPVIIDNFRMSLPVVPAGLDLIEGFFETFDPVERFDVIEAGFVFEHVDDPMFILKRLHALLTPGARLFIAVPNARSLHRTLGHEAGLLPDLFELSNADRALGHQRYFDVPSLHALVTTAGFRIESTEGMLLKPFTTSQMAQLQLSDSIWAALQVVAREYPELSNAICLEATVCS
jgi:SAM-dependent methyltransferase